MADLVSSALRMDELLHEWERTADRRAVFLDCYARMTRAMIRHLDAGAFDDADWVARLLDDFAQLYFVALESWERGDATTPGPWVVAHDAARAADRSPAQLLLAGVNAHINYDLVLAVSNLLVDHDDAERRRHDYERVNDVIAATADEVQDGVLERYVPWSGPADVVLGRLDEWMAVRLLRSWRSDVWRQAQRLLPVPPADRAAELARIDARCCRRGRLILLDPA